MPEKTKEWAFEEAIEAVLVGDEALAASLRANSAENSRLTFGHVRELQSPINAAREAPILQVSAAKLAQRNHLAAFVV